MTNFYITHSPTINIDSALKKLSSTELKIVALCSVKPLSQREIADILNKDMFRVCQIVCKLALQGWLASVRYHVNGDTFTQHNHPGTLQRTYPAIRSERIDLPTTRKRLNGEWN